MFSTVMEELIWQPMTTMFSKKRGMEGKKVTPVQFHEFMILNLESDSQSDIRKYINQKVTRLSLKN